MGERNYNWSAAFAAYCRGTDIEEIGEVFGIPKHLVIARSSEERWPALKADLLNECRAVALANAEVPETGGAPKIGLPAKLAAKQELLQRNRERSYQEACTLRDHLLEVITALRDGTLELEKVFCQKGVIVRAKVKPGPGDWLNLASYARTVAELAYRSLGDAPSDGKDPSSTAAAAPGAGPPGITIILPNVIARPRAERCLEPEVIDLQSPAPEKPAH